MSLHVCTTTLANSILVACQLSGYYLQKCYTTHMYFNTKKNTCIFNHRIIWPVICVCQICKPVNANARERRCTWSCQVAGRVRQRDDAREDVRERERGREHEPLCNMSGVRWLHDVTHDERAAMESIAVICLFIKKNILCDM